MKIRLFTKDNEVSENVRNDLEDILVSNGYELSNKDDFNIGISIGGDGKFINMIHECEFDTKKKYIGINTGNLGFLTSYNKNSIGEFLDDLKDKNFIDNKYKFLTIKIISNDEYNETIYNALNEVVIRNTLYKTLHLTTYIDSTLLYSYSGDGLCISTPIGSTAYNLSLGGPIVDNTMDAVIINPLAALNNNVYKNCPASFVTSSDNKIIVKPNNKNNSTTLIIDGKAIHIKDLLSIEITSNKSISVLKDVDYNHIINLNNKIYK